ncbi:MAG: hypothetical protein LKF96_03360, partial [Treponema sp.]|nr:hypothetical protein [Treponema sp.]
MTKTAFPHNLFFRIFYSLHHALSLPGRRPLRAALCAVVLAGMSAAAWGTDYIWTGNGTDSSWTTAANWDTGSAPATNEPTADITIPAGCTNYPKLTAGISIGSLTVDGMLDCAGQDITAASGFTNNGTLRFSGTANTITLTSGTASYGSANTIEYYGGGVCAAVSGTGAPAATDYYNLTVTDTDTVVQLNSLSITVDGTLSNEGTVEINGTGVFDFSTSAADTDSGLVKYSSTTAETTTIPALSYYNLEVSGGTWTDAAALTAANSIAVSGGQLTCASTLTAGEDLSVSVGTLQTNGNLSVTGALSVSSGSLTMNGGSASAGTCSFTGGTIDFGNSSGDSFTVGSGGISFPAVLTAVSGAGSITATDSTISLGKNVTLNGALTFKSAVSLTADVSFVTGTSAYGLEFDDNVSCTTYTLETTGTGETTIASSATLSATTGTMTFGGKVTNGGTITGSTGKITFSGDVTNNGTINVPDAGTGSTGVEFDGTYSDSTSGTLVGNTTSNPYLDFKASSVAFRDGGFTANGDIVRFNGTDAQTFTPGSNTFAGVVIDNSAGVSSGALSCSDFTQTSGNTTFSGSLTCSGDITIVDGTLTLGGATSAVSVTIDSDSDNDGKLASNSNTITLSGSWTNNNDGNSGTDGFACGTGTVLFTDNSVLSSITGDNTFYNFTCTTAGKTLTFEGGDTQTIASGGKFTINGQAAGTEITLTSSNTSKWILAVTANPDQVDVSYATVSYAEATDVIISAVTNSAEGVPGTTVNWFNADYYWTGGTDASWDTTSNWKIGSASGSTPSIVPSKDNSSVTITISDSSSTVLTLAAPITAMKKITVDGSQTVDFAGQNVTATDITNNGTVKLAGTQTLTFTNTPVNGTASTVEYTATGNAAPVWHDTGTTTDSYHNLTVDSGCVLQLGSQSVSIDTTNSGVLSNSGTVEIDDTGSINKSDSTTGKFIYSYSGGGTLPALDGYYDLTISSSPWTSGGDITVKNDLSLDAVDVTLDQETSGTVNTLALKGSVSGNYMLTANDVNVDTSSATSITDTSFTFTGDENQSFTPNASLTYPSITVSKTGGTLTVATNALTTAALSVTGGSCTFDRLITVTDTSLTDLTTTGTVAFGAGGIFAGGVTHTAGQTDITGTLTATGKDITLGASDKGIVLTGATVLTTGTDAGTISLEGVVTGSGNQLTLTAGTGDVTASKDIGISSAYIGDFSASGATVTFSGTIYAASTDITGTTSIALDGGSVTTTGTQTYTGDVTFGTDTTLTAYG